MQILFNELSLTGQFSDEDDCVKRALLPFVSILKEIQGFSTLLLKKSDVWSRMITPTSDLHSLLRGRSHEIRRLKSAIFKLTQEPYWDFDSKQKCDTTYHFEGTDIKGTSLAEACERDEVVVSFVLSSTSFDPLEVMRNEEIVSLLNLTESGVLTEYLWNRKKIAFETYLKARFSKSKLDFSNVDKKMGFSVVQPVEQSLFIDTFKKFETLTWDQIHSDKGLDYKEYHGTIGGSHQNTKTYKFRVSQKFRCHGYRQKDSFTVIGFETDHKLSDQG